MLKPFYSIFTSTKVFSYFSLFSISFHMMIKSLIFIFFTSFHIFALDIIGNFETVKLNQFTTNYTVAKVDTGAVYSALHCTYIKLNEDENSVLFTLLDSNTTFKKKIVKIANIKSSNGQEEKRPIIETTIILGKETYPIKFSLTNRSAMKTKILLGTDFIKNRFLVDVSKQNLKD